MAALDVQAVKDRALRTLKDYSPSQLAILGVLVVVALVGGLAFLRWVSAPTYSVLLAGLDPKDASAVTSQLETDGVAYQLEAGGTTVLVPADVLDQERLKVAAAGLPAGRTDSGWAVFDKQGMTSSSFQQQVAYQRALEGTLGSTLEGIDGVDAATVHLALPEKSAFTEQQEPARASVLLTTRRPLDGGAVDAITRLVASSVPGLAPEDVSVSDEKGLLSASGTGAGGEAQAALEDTLSTRATSMLDTLLGPGHAVVRVRAELETGTRSTDSEVYDDTKTAVTHESGTTETYTAPPGATTGGTVAVPLEVTTGTGATGTGSGDYRKAQSDKDLGVSRTVTSEKQGPGGVKRLTVAVAVDARAQNAPTPAELRDLVGNAVGLDAARGDTIAVSTPAFLAPEDPAAGAPAGGGITGTATGLLPSVLGGIVLLLVALGLLRTVRRVTTTEVPAEQVTAALASAGRPAALPGQTARELPAGPAAEPVGVVELVEEHPDEVAHLLRGWMAGSPR